MNIPDILDSLAMRFPICMASDEFHFFPQATAKAFDWSLWDDFSQATVTDTIAQLRVWEKQFDSLSNPAVSTEDQMDASMMARMLRTLREQFELVRPQETQPTFYLTILGIGLAEAMEAGSRAMEKRSENLTLFMDRAIQNLKRVPRLFLGIGMEMLEEQQKWISSLSLPEGSSVTILNAMERFGKHLKQVRADEEFLPDVQLYERIAAQHMGCGLLPDDIARELEMEIEETRSILDGSAATDAAGRSWQEIVENLPRPPLLSGGIQEMYRETIAELSRHCLSIGMVSEELVRRCPVKVEPIPDYMRTIRSNAAYSMPPLHPPRGGTFFLQDAQGAAALPADYRLLTAHETYPGHHLLDTCRWGLQRPARRHIEFPVFYEGWASFAEELMFETGLFSGPVDEMLMAKRRFWRAMRGKAELDLHMRRKNLDKAADFLSSQGMAPHRARTVVRRYCLKPGYQLSYTIGRRQFRKIFTDTGPARKNPVAFARRVLELGEIGFGHLEKALRQGE